MPSVPPPPPTARINGSLSLEQGRQTQLYWGATSAVRLTSNGPAYEFSCPYVYRFSGDSNRFSPFKLQNICKISIHVWGLKFTMYYITSITCWRPQYSLSQLLIRFILCWNIKKEILCLFNIFFFYNFYKYYSSTYSFCYFFFLFTGWAGSGRHCNFLFPNWDAV